MIYAPFNNSEQISVQNGFLRALWRNARPYLHDAHGGSFVAEASYFRLLEHKTW
jgi:hypothetical protein